MNHPAAPVPGKNPDYPREGLRIESDDVIAQWKDIVKRVEIKGPIPMKFSVQRYHENRQHMDSIACIADVPSVVPGQAQGVDISFPLAALGPPSLDALYRIARWFYVHELTEHFKVDGAFFIKPHNERGDTLHNWLDAPDGRERFVRVK